MPVSDELAERFEEEARTKRLLGTTIASTWANEFMRLFALTKKPLAENIVMDDEEAWGLMVGWFANAIEVGRSAGLEGKR